MDDLHLSLMQQSTHRLGEIQRLQSELAEARKALTKGLEVLKEDRQSFFHCAQVDGIVEDENDRAVLEDYDDVIADMIAAIGEKS